MLDNLTNRFSNVLKNIRGQAKLTEDNIKEALREVRLAPVSYTHLTLPTKLEV